MKTFINENFLFTNKTAIDLYHKYSEKQPVIDFHCHLSPAMIDDDINFRNFTHAWLDGDHYKWRAMRTNGIEEKFCTGDASDAEKFVKWAKTVPYTAGNPLYHWTHLELARYFGITELLSGDTANEIYEKASSLLSTKEYSVRSLLKKMNVQVVCTTDDPADDLIHHFNMKGKTGMKILPTFRPDMVTKVEDPASFRKYVDRLSRISGTEIRSFELLISVLDSRHEFFHKAGCRLSDHGLDRLYFTNNAGAGIESIFSKLMSGKTPDQSEAEQFKTCVMLELCRMNHKRGWTQQFHLGALRNNNSRLFAQLGPDTGWDSIGQPQDPNKISKFLNELDSTDQLAKTILYNLNPADNAMMITMAGNFNDGSSAVKVQYGAAWWFLDQKSGIEKHLSDLASFGLLSRFIGMVTDSRSFLSYPRHEYFRRLVCNFVGEEVEKGLIPADDYILKTMIEGISYKNARGYFGFQD